MSKNKYPGGGKTQEIDTVYLKPPVKTDESPPPFANNARIMGAADGMVLHLYFISPTRLLGASEGNPQAGVLVTGNIVTIESEPVARVALSMSTATEVAMLIFKNLIEGMPQVGATLSKMAEQMVELMEQANRATSVQPDAGQPAEMPK